MTDFPDFHLRRIDDAHRRLDQHQIDISTLQTRAATSDERHQTIQRDLADIKGGVTWITRLIVGGMVAAILAFIVKGGLNVG